MSFISTGSPRIEADRTLVQDRDVSPEMHPAEVPVSATSGSLKQSIPWLLRLPACLGMLLAICVYLFVSTSMVDPDIWWHLRNAQYLLETRSFLTSDMYSSTIRGTPWINYEWLGELPFYLGWKLGGDQGLFVVTVAAVECIFLGVFYLASRHSGNVKAALIPSVVGAFLATVSFGPRTLLFGWVALVAELILLQRFAHQLPRSGRHLILLLPVLFLCWVNMHGSWLIGMVLLLLFFLCGCVSMQEGMITSTRWTVAQRRHLCLASALSCAALFINPYGWRMVFYPFDIAFRQKLNLASVEEWQSLDFQSPRARVLLVLLVLLALAQLWRPRKWKLDEVAFCLLGIYASFTHVRFLFLAAILLAPSFARSIPGMRPYRKELDKPWLNALILCMLVPVVLHHFPRQKEAAAAVAKEFPVKALPFLRTFRPQGNVFTNYFWGGYLEWNVRQFPVFIDSRVDIYERRGVLKDYLDVIRIHDTLAVLDKYRIRYVLFKTNEPLVYLLQQTHGWTVTYQDEETIMLERVPPSFAGSSVQ